MGLTEIHVWRASLDLPVAEKRNLNDILSSDELERAGRFRFERDQNRFVMARAILRRLLGRYLEKDPRELRFMYTSHGKPYLENDAGHDTLCFNLSHSGAMVIYAFARKRNIGIDMEEVRHDVMIDPVMQRFFTQEECSMLDSLHESKRIESFFTYWTRKEAFIKATGEGVSFPIEQCDVSGVHEGVLSRIILPKGMSTGEHWHVLDLFPGPGYVAAIAAEGSDWTISCREYAE